MREYVRNQEQFLCLKKYLVKIAESKSMRAIGIDKIELDQSRPNEYSAASEPDNCAGIGNFDA